MKKATRWVFFPFLVAFFVALPVHAGSFLYFQQNDESGRYQLLNKSGTQILGNFTLANPLTFGSANPTTFNFWYTNNGTTQVVISISSTTNDSYSSLVDIGCAISLGDSGGENANTNCTTSVNATLNAGVEYYITAYDNGSPANHTTLFTNGSNNAFYGIISEQLGNPTFLDGNIPGLTDFGISTTSQQQNCANNFATSTFLTQVAGDFASGLCNVSVFLFVPGNTAIAQWTNIGNTTAQKFPFSWVYSITTTLQGLTASSTANSPAFAFNLHDLGIGSTSPIGNILPNYDGFSTTSVETYLTPDLLSALKGLASVALIVGLVADIFFTSRNLIS